MISTTTVFNWEFSPIIKTLRLFIKFLFFTSNFNNRSSMGKMSLFHTWYNRTTFSVQRWKVTAIFNFHWSEVWLIVDFFSHLPSVTFSSNFEGEFLPSLYMSFLSWTVLGYSIKQSTLIWNVTGRNRTCYFRSHNNNLYLFNYYNLYIFNSTEEGIVIFFPFQRASDVA